MRKDLVPNVVHDIGESLRARASHYGFDGIVQECDVCLVRSHERQFNCMAEWSLSSGQQYRRLITKWNRNGSQEFKPRTAAESYLVPGPDRPGAEWEAMSKIESHFADRSDLGVFTVPVLDSLMDNRVLVLERADAVSLSKWVRRSAVPNPASRRKLLQAIENSARWLREFHSLDPDPTSSARGTTRSEFQSWSGLVCGRMETNGFNRDLISKLRARLRNAADQHLPADLPVRTLHDDFAPRNVLVDSNGLVAGIDLTMEWKGCVWEDLSRFVTSLFLDKLRVASLGLALRSGWIDQLEETFYEAYFGSEPIPWPAMRLYQAQTALTSLAASTTTSAAKCESSAASAVSSVPHSWIQRQVARHTFAFVEDRMEKIRRDRILRMPTLMQLETLGGRG